MALASPRVFAVHLTLFTKKSIIASLSTLEPPIFKLSAWLLAYEPVALTLNELVKANSSLEVNHST